MVDLVIFDCDGVLVDSERLAVRIDIQVLARLGWHLTEAEVVSRFVGVSDAEFRRQVETYLGRRLADDWEAEFQPLYQEAFQAELRPIDGIFEALDQIPYRTCVASSGTHEKIRFTLGLTGLYDRFVGRIFSAADVETGKPAPDLFLYAAERMGAPPSTVCGNRGQRARCSGSACCWHACAGLWWERDNSREASWRRCGRLPRHARTAGALGADELPLTRRVKLWSLTSA